MLERLAERHDVAALLTRPDAPAGRGRRLAAPPAKQVAERLGIPVLQPERPAAGLELDAPTVVVCAYGLLVPTELLSERAWLNVHPSLLPRWRGAAPVERAIMAGDAETGVTIHETVAALDAGPVAAQEAFPIGPEDDAGAVYARAAEVAARLLDDVLARPEPRFEPQQGEPTYAEKIRPEDRWLDLTRPAGGAGARRQGAQSPHRREDGARGTPRDRVAGQGRRRRAVRAPRGAAGGRPEDVRRGVAPRAQVSEASPARRAAFAVLRRVFEDGAYADRAFRSESASLDERDRALAGGSPTARSSGSGRSTTRSRRSAGDRCGSSTHPCARRSASARTSWRSSTASRATPPSTSRSSSSAVRAWSGRSRSRTPSSAGSPTERGRSARRFPSAPRRRPPCATPTRTGSPRHGGASSARTTHAR